MARVSLPFRLLVGIVDRDGLFGFEDYEFLGIGSTVLRI